jgi:hypothetical protein
MRPALVRPVVLAQVLILSALSLPAQEEGGKDAPPEAPPTAEPPPAEPPAEGAVPAEPAAKEPEFKKETTKADFEKAKGLLAEGKARQAESIFKKAKNDAKSKEDKDLVDVWILSSTGLQVLEKLKAVARQGKLHVAYNEAQTQLAKYAKTSAAPAFKEFIAEIESKLYVVIQPFEVPVKERWGQSSVDDPKLVFEGTRSLRWQNTEDRKPVPLKIEGVPRDWREFEAVEFHTKVSVSPGTPEAILVCGLEGAAPKAAKKGEAQHSFKAVVKLPSGGEWQRVRIPMSDFIPSGNPSLANVLHFQMQCQGGRQFDLLLDKLVLVKKDPGPAGATRAKAAGKKK